MFSMIMSFHCICRFELLLVGARSPLGQTLAELMANLKASVQAKVNKNVEVLQLSSQICRRMRGLRFTSCKSAKDRTGMSVTLEQVNILSAEYHLAEHEYTRALDCMRRLLLISSLVPKLWMKRPRPNSIQ